MERKNPSNMPARLERQLSHLKIISRLLGHELHAQTSPRITLTREEVIEIQTSIDLFIEEIHKSRSTSAAAGGSPFGEIEVQAVPARRN